MNKLGLKTVAWEFSGDFISKVLIPKDHILMLRIDTYIFGKWPYTLFGCIANDHDVPEYTGGIQIPNPAAYATEESALVAAEDLKLKLNLLALRISEIKITEEFGNFVVLDGEEFVANCVSEAHAELIKQDLIERL